MTSNPSPPMLDALLARDRDGLADAIRSMLRHAPPRSVHEGILRFAIAAFNPSLHAVLSFVVASEAAHVVDSVSDPAALLLECGAYAADTRLPWSEPPIASPPSPRDDIDLAEAIAAGSRLDAERWLAAAMARPGFEREYLEAAVRYSADAAHGLTVAVHALECAAAYDASHRFPVLRLAPDLWTASRSREDLPFDPSGDPDVVWHSIVRGVVDSGGDIVAFHRAEAFDAWLRMGAILDERPVATRESGEVAPYVFARDFGAAFIASRIAARWATLHPRVSFDAMVEVQLRHRDTAEYDRWSHA